MTEEKPTTSTAASELSHWFRRTLIIILTLLLALTLYLLSEAPMWVLIHHRNTPQWLYKTYYVIYTPVDWFADTPIDPFLNKWWYMWVSPA